MPLSLEDRGFQALVACDDTRNRMKKLVGPIPALRLLKSIAEHPEHHLAEHYRGAVPLTPLSAAYKTIKAMEIKKLVRPVNKAAENWRGVPVYYEITSLGRRKLDQMMAHMPAALETPEDARKPKAKKRDVKTIIHTEAA
jgi:hypothetical protein